jgi:hypothetical protein
MADRVCIGSCVDPADAAVVRAMLSGHGIAAVVTGEQHANLLGGLGGPLISLDIWVAAEDAEEADQLLREFRAGHGDDDSDADADDAAERDEHAAGESSASSIDARIGRRKGTGIVLLLGMCVTFGTAHMYARAWMRGISLAALEVVGLFQLAHSPAQGAALVSAAIITDVVGAILRVRADTALVRLPAARLRR